MEGWKNGGATLNPKRKVQRAKCKVPEAKRNLKPACPPKRNEGGKPDMQSAES